MLITGASQGIGKALAEAAVARGARVLAAARSEPLLKDLVEAVRARGGTIQTVPADVTSPEGRQRMVDAARQHFGGLDVLVNNAGIGATGHFVEAAPERLRQIMEVNFFGLTETTRAFLPMLKEGNQPAIVNISSIAGRRGIPARSEYSASKFAVQGFSEAIRTELARTHRCAHRLARSDADQFLEEHARAEGPSADGPHARHDVETWPGHARCHREGYDGNDAHVPGKLMVFVSRFLPRLADRIAARRACPVRG